MVQCVQNQKYFAEDIQIYKPVIKVQIYFLNLSSFQHKSQIKTNSNKDDLDLVDCNISKIKLKLPQRTTLTPVIGLYKWNTNDLHVTLGTI